MRGKTSLVYAVLCAALQVVITAATAASATPRSPYLWSATLQGRATEVQIGVTHGVVLVSGGYDAASQAFPLDCGTARANCRARSTIRGRSGGGIALRGSTIYVTKGSSLSAFRYPCARGCRPL